MQYPSIDVVIPISKSWMIPYLKNTLGSIERQNYPSNMIGITLSLVVDSDGDDFSELLNICKRYNATLVCTHPSDPAFNIAKAYNVAARKGAREVIACIDVDVVWHPSTFKYAFGALRNNGMAILPVVRWNKGPQDQVFTEVLPSLNSEERWNELTRGLNCARCANGNVLVSRKVFEHVHGYDERFYGWGACDNDFFARVRSHAGARHLIDTKCPKGIHQRHKRRPDVESKNTRRNRTLLSQSKNIVRNAQRWGDVPVGKVLSQ